MGETIEKVEELSGHLKEYVNIKMDAVKLEVAEKASSVFGRVITGTIILVIFFIGFLFANFSVANALSDWLEKSWAGFLILAAFYFIIALIIWLVRDKLIRIPLMNFFIKLIFNKEEDDNNQ